MKGKKRVKGMGKERGGKKGENSEGVGAGTWRWRRNKEKDGREEKAEEEVVGRGGELKQKVRYVDVQRRFRHRPNLQTATGFGSSTPAV